MNPMVHALSAAALAVIVYMLVLYAVALARRDNSIADVGWGPGFLVALLAALWLRTTVDPRQSLVVMLVAIWAFRLSLHILMRNWGRGEDSRYAAMRQGWGTRAFWHSFWQVFALQGALMLVILLPALYMMAYVGPRLWWLDLVGVVIWLKGYCAESIADYQLMRFQKDPANQGHTMQSGIWKYSRHPNYYGEALQWWGIWVLALSVPGAWVTVIGPLTITFLLLRVSGIPMVESRRSKDPEYRDYARRTPAFIPWFPRSH